MPTATRPTTEPVSGLQPLARTPRGPRASELCRCGRCPAVWTGADAAHCPTCHETFTTVGNFDRHRRGGTCAHPEVAGMVERTRNGRPIWGMPGPDPTKIDIDWRADRG